MARAIWSGAISFGLVNVPVKLFTATSPKTVRFNQLSSKTGARIRQKRVDPTTDEEVPYEDIVKGYEITPDQYVMITNEELEALDPKATKTIDIEEFVDLAEIDPIFYDHNYYLAPTAGGAKAYRLLLDAMRESGKVGIGKVVLRSKQQLCALRPTGEVLTLTTMLWGDEVLSPDRLDEIESVTEAEATPRELAMAEQLISTLSAAFEPDKYHDEYREQVLELIERKAAGETIIAPAPEEEPAAAPDLMAALEASLAAVRADSGEGADAPVPSAAPAKQAPKPAAKPAAAKSSRSRGSAAKPDGAGKAPAKAKR
jgi:DNA end-binding protein Ku